MNSTCLLLQQLFLGSALWLRPVTTSSSSEINSRLTSPWRPWLSNSRAGPEQCPQSKLSCPYSRPTARGCSLINRKPQLFKHPVRLFWPMSKLFDSLFRDGEALLRNFPIQATISFCDMSDCEDEEEDCKEGSISTECIK